MYDNTFEKPPETLNQPHNEEAELRAAEWNQAMGSDDVPQFAGEGAEFASENNTEVQDAGANEYDEQISDAAALINYGLDAAARKYGVEAVVQGVKTFDGTGSSDPIGDLFNHLGVDTAVEARNIHDINRANKSENEYFREQAEMPANVQKSTEGAFRAIADMKELISEVEGADPAYEGLRMSAREAGKGYFEYAVSSLQKRGLTDLFGALKEFKKPAEEEPKEETAEKTPEDEEPTGEEEII